MEDRHVAADARTVAQSITHLISVSEVAVTIRATFFSIQLAIMAYWVFQLGMLGFQ